MDLIDKKRHTLAHLLAAAVCDIYKDSKMAIGPTTDDGFYYDMKIPSKISITDLPQIEEKMREILKTWGQHKHTKIDVKTARETFKDNPFKLELIDEFIEKGEDITMVTFGDFVDLCAGGHIDDAKDIDSQSFKLVSVAASYWRGDEKNESLTRIYGYAFNTKKELEEYIHLKEEAKKRDHRKLGKELGLFIFEKLVGPGLPLFTPKGTAMREAIIKKIDSIQPKIWVSKSLYTTPCKRRTL